MIKNKSLNNSQVQKPRGSKGSAEYQTFRLFAILGALTLLLVFVIRVVQYDPYNVAKSQVANSVTGTTGDRSEPKSDLLRAPAAKASFISTILPEFLTNKTDPHQEK